MAARKRVLILDDQTNWLDVIEKTVLDACKRETGSDDIDVDRRCDPIPAAELIRDSSEKDYPYDLIVADAYMAELDDPGCGAEVIYTALSERRARSELLEVRLVVATQFYGDMATGLGARIDREQRKLDKALEWCYPVNKPWAEGTRGNPAHHTDYESWVKLMRNALFRPNSEWLLGYLALDTDDAVGVDPLVNKAVMVANSINATDSKAPFATVVIVAEPGAGIELVTRRLAKSPREMQEIDCSICEWANAKSRLFDGYEESGNVQAPWCQHTNVHLVTLRNFTAEWISNSGQKSAFAQFLSTGKWNSINFQGMVCVHVRDAKEVVWLPQMGVHLRYRIELPRLRQRTDRDTLITRAFERERLTLDQPAAALLRAYAWEDDVRELFTAVRAVRRAIGSGNVSVSTLERALQIQLLTLTLTLSPRATDGRRKIDARFNFPGLDPIPWTSEARQLFLSVAWCVQRSGSDVVPRSGVLQAYRDLLQRSRIPSTEKMVSLLLPAGESGIRRDVVKDINNSVLRPLKNAMCWIDQHGRTFSQEQKGFRWGICSPGAISLVGFDDSG